MSHGMGGTSDLFIRKLFQDGVEERRILDVEEVKHLVLFRQTWPRFVSALMSLVVARLEN